MIWRPEFEAASRLFAEVTASIEARGFAAPVRVGGAAMEISSGSATGDFDVVTARTDAFEAPLRAHGFVRPRW